MVSHEKRTSLTDELKVCMDELATYEQDPNAYQNNQSPMSFESSGTNTKEE